MSSIEEIQQQPWDYLVVGTGVGGATLGHALAKAGRKVLFLEKGRVPFLHVDTLQGAYPEMHFPRVDVPTAARHASFLAQAGRCHDEFLDGLRSFIPFIGCGAGGSSALYGMAMERFFPADFEPQQHFPNSSGSSLPHAWPIRYADLVPYYQRAEKLYRVRGQYDPLRPQAPDLLPPPSLSPRNAELYSHFQGQGLHPYQLPQACEFVPGCECCQGYLCAKNCKNDAGRICLEPAVRDLGAAVLDECEVIQLEATSDRVTGVVCRWQGRTVTLRGDQVILAAGALMTPGLLLRSTSVHWPQGLANASGLVGRNLMRHYVDLYLVFTRARGENRLKELGLSDFYQFQGNKLGTLQSFGLLPPAPVLAATMAKDVCDAAPWATPLFRLAQPLLRLLLTRLFKRGVLLAAIMEDLPYADNRVVPGSPPRIDYRIHPHDQTRLKVFRTRVAKALKPYRFLALHQAEKNSMLAHVCGTCRFGEDPENSVLDPFNRAHGIQNLYVVDSSFFPSSGGTNPALTIAANALRVAEHLLTPGGLISDKPNTQTHQPRSMPMTETTSRIQRHSLLRMTLHTEISIDASPKQIWGVLTDFPGYQFWNQSIPHAEGEAKAGTLLRVVIQWPGLKSSPYELEILDALPERELRWLGHFGKTGLMDGDHRFVLEPTVEGRTKVIQSEYFSGLLVPFFAPWLKKNVLSGFEQMNVALKNRVESATPAQCRDTP